MNKIITIIGKTNTGKSTLFNKLINKKKSIITKKKNTTITCVTYNINDHIILSDTPGPILKNTNKNINNILYNEIKKSTIILIVLDGICLTTEDHFILELINTYEKEKIILLNKIDKIRQKYKILEFIKKITEKYKKINQIIPISSKENININKIKSILNINNNENNITQKYKKNYMLITKNLIRETLLTKLDKEVPYLTEINILNKKLNKEIRNILIQLNIKKKSHKKIIIGRHGQKINEIINDLNNKLKNIYKKIQNIKILINNT